MFPVLETIQTFVAPVVMISANGLLCLAFCNRLSALVGRSRTMNQERFELTMRLAALREPENHAAEAGQLRQRIDILDDLNRQLFSRAWWLRGAVVGLLVSVLCMLVCSLALGLAAARPMIAWLALVFFVAGALAMMAGVVMAIMEIRGVLDPLMFEHEGVEQPPEET